MKTGGFIIAADIAAGSEAMQKLGSLSIAQRICMTFHLCGVKPVVLLVSASISEAESEMLEKQLARMPVILIQRQELQVGLSFLLEQCDQVLVTPIHVPLFSVETVNRLLASKKELAVPVYNGVVGHPLLVHGPLLKHLLESAGVRGLWAALPAHAHLLESIPVEDPGVLIRSDQFEECEKIVASHDLNQWRPVMKLRIARESAFLGPGSWQLLSLIESTGSVRIASQFMGISYSKAWKLLNHLEEQAGFPVLYRQKGGTGGGSSQLTAQGKALMTWYERLEGLCNQAVTAIFHENPFVLEQTPPIFSTALALKPGAVVSLIGCGGKTTLLNRLAMENRNLRTAVSTTTKIYPPPEALSCLLPKSPDKVRPGLSLLFSRKEKGKLVGLSPEALALWQQAFDLMLLEADGSKGLPLKGWAEHEPVIPAYTTLTIGLCTVHPVGHPCDAARVHRLERFCRLTGARPGTPLTPEHLAAMVAAPGGMFSKAHGRRVLFINQITTPAEKALAQKLAEKARRLDPKAEIRFFCGDIHKGIIEELEVSEI